jgi:hypothetical protein
VDLCFHQRFKFSYHFFLVSLGEQISHRSLPQHILLSGRELLEWGVSTIDPGGECFYAAIGCSISLTKADLRVLASGVPASHSPIRTKLRAVAVSRCCK